MKIVKGSIDHAILNDLIKTTSNSDVESTEFEILSILNNANSELVGINGFDTMMKKNWWNKYFKYLW